MDIEIIAGLGNPGRKYEATRHNLGFRVVESLFDSAGCSGLAEWKTSDDLQVAEVAIAGERRFLLKPQSFMNRSGEPLASFLRYRNIAVHKLVVVHDELDLPLGALRIKRGGGDGGHNGIRSVTQQLGTNDFVRVRLGIGRPVPMGAQGQGPAPEVSDWVLGKFSGEESTIADKLVERGAVAVEELLRGSLESAQRLYNTGSL